MCIELCMIISLLLPSSHIPPSHQTIFPTSYPTFQKCLIVCLLSHWVELMLSILQECVVILRGCRDIDGLAMSEHQQSLPCFYYFICCCRYFVWMFVCVPHASSILQARRGYGISLELKLQTDMSCHRGLEVGRRFYRRRTSALNLSPRAISFQHGE